MIFLWIGFRLEVMVLIKAHIAEGSFLGMGTHVWLEVIDGDGVKVTFSGSKAGGALHVIRDYKRDYDRAFKRGLLEVLAPDGLSDAEWSGVVIAAAEEVLDEMHGNYAFSGIWPWGRTRGGVPRSNCCAVVFRIIERAGGEVPRGRVKGVLPGLGRGWIDYI